mgnify:CR=1 FL=1
MLLQLRMIIFLTYWQGVALAKTLQNWRKMGFLGSAMFDILFLKYQKGILFQLSHLMRN